VKVSRDTARHTYHLRREVWVPQQIETTFAFFCRPENLQALTPDWLNFRIVECPMQLEKGSLIRYALGWRILPISWTTEITEWEPPLRFVDTQLSGPYRLWRHEHQFLAMGQGALIRDHVEYALYGWPLSIPIHHLIVRRDLDRIFDFRTARLEQLLGTEKIDSHE
jgi:ligand-binding SRPBCC domain-containing protein